MGEMGILTYIPCSDSKWIFTESPSGEPMCPSGVVALHPERHDKKGEPTTRLVIRACRSCSWQSRCGGKTEKSLSFPTRVDPTHWVRQRDRAKSDEAREAKIQRSATVELCFAFIKHHLKLDRFLLRGLIGTQIEFSMAAIALNLKTLVKHLQARGLQALIQLFWRILRPLEVHRGFRNSQNFQSPPHPIKLNNVIYLLPTAHPKAA
jgi:hypothetical protein